MKLEKEVKIIDYGLGQNNAVIELETLSQFNDIEFITFNEILKNKKLKLTLEVQEPILDEEERKYLSGVIRPFKDIVKGISKMKSVNKENMEYILITLADTECSYMAFPYFKKEKMYKNMKLNKRYTLEELEL